jgi:hypothetical protein
VGEYADMLLDGSYCEVCAMPFGDGDAPGYPRTHRRCREPVPPTPPKPKCPVCGKKVKPTGLTDHQRDAHKIKEPTDEH